MVQPQKHKKTLVLKWRVNLWNIQITAQPFLPWNFPEVSLPEHVGTKRLLHIHENRPGVLNKLNQIFVEANLNIAAQFLQTDPKIGYVVVDIETDDASPLLAKLREIEGTIKARVLY